MTDIMAIIQAGMSHDEKRVETLSQNLANTQTVGYKRLIETLEQNHLSTNQTASQGRVRDFSQGQLKHTGHLSDIALDTGVLLGVQSQAGPAYTRDGQLRVNAEGQLVLASGEAILSQAGQPIYLKSNNFQVSAKGQVIEQGQLVASLFLVKPASMQQLSYMGAGLYQSEDSLEALPADQIRIMPGYLELSNVNSMKEMVQLIESTRHFESQAKLLTAYDEVLGKSINDLANF